MQYLKPSLLCAFWSLLRSDRNTVQTVDLLLVDYLHKRSGRCSKDCSAQHEAAWPTALPVNMWQTDLGLTELISKVWTT
ncbi:hypothetical protein F5I97DRAFT_1908695 [Phlebopus sp. FC_14]|nr:hypothetical protein F5I97DRAFT_1908695 [Phlebopus sp. FC_14]